MPRLRAAATKKISREPESVTRLRHTPSGEVTVKSYFPKTQGRIELRPANPEYNVQIYSADEVTIQGRVVELRRKY